MALPESTERRLMDFIKREMYHEDAYYHVLIDTFRNWLIAMNLAMRDEGIDPDIAEQVLNRVVYGTPSPAIAHERQESRKQQRELLEHHVSLGSLPTMFVDEVTRARGEGDSGSRPK